MSRSNPDKKKRRAAKKTILVYGEGMAEKVFLEYLRMLYSRNSGTAVTIRKGKGGSARDIVNNACNFPGAFDHGVKKICMKNSFQKIC